MAAANTSTNFIRSFCGLLVLLKLNSAGAQESVVQDVSARPAQMAGAQAEGVAQLQTSAPVYQEPSFNIKTNALMALYARPGFEIEIPMTDHLTIGPSFMDYRLMSSGSSSFGSYRSSYSTDVSARTYGVRLSYHFRIWDRSGSCISFVHRWFPGRMSGNVDGQAVEGSFNSRVFGLSYFFQWRRPSGLNFAFGGGLDYLAGIPKYIRSNGYDVEVPNAAFPVNPYAEVSIGWLL